LSASLASIAPDAQLRLATVSTTLGITESDRLAAIFSGAGAEVENLEAFSVVRAAGDIPVTVVLGVTNIVGKGGGEDWLGNFREMMQLVARTVLFSLIR
jgi:hypothetical protein